MSREGESITVGSRKSAKVAKFLGRDLFYLVLILCGLCLFFREALAGRRTLVWDAADYFYPLFFSVSEALRQWRLPLWTPYLFSGFPTIGNIEAQTFYPLNLLFLPFSAFTPYVVYLSIIFHCFIAGISMYFLAKRFTGNRMSGFLAATAYMYSGFFIGHVQHVTMIEVMAWLPLVFLLLDEAIETERLRYSIAAGLVLGISILAGHPQTSHAMIVVLAIHALWRGSGAARQQGTWRPFLLSTRAFSCCLLIAVLLAAVQLLPTMELTREAVRGAPVTFETAARSGQFSLAELLSLLVPNYFGAISQPYWGTLDISQSILYIGVVPLFCASYALLAGRSRKVLYWAILAGASLLLALGEHGPLFRLFYAVFPGFKYFRSPAHTVFVFSFFAALLAGYGFGELCANLRKKVFWGLVAVWALIGLAVYLFGPAPSGLMAETAKRNLLFGLGAFGATLALATAIVAAGNRFVRLGGYSAALLLLVAFADCYLHFASAETSGIAASPAYVAHVPTRITQIRAASGITSVAAPSTILNASEMQNGLFRVYTRPEGILGTSPFGFNRAMIHRTFLVGGFEPLELSRQRTLISSLSSANLVTLLQLLNVKYISTLGADDERFETVPPAVYVPRVNFVANARFFAEDEPLLQAMRTFDPRREVLISGSGTDLVGGQLDDTKWRAEVERYEDNHVRIRATSPGDGYLVLSDAYYPGWTARVDGVPVPLLRANYHFRTVALPKGEHVVAFDFSSRTLMVGGIITGLTLLLSLAFLAGPIFPAAWTQRPVCGGEREP